MFLFIRKNIGFVFTFLGFFLLVIITFGNIVDVFTPIYWLNVYKNLLSIGMLSVSLVFIQTMIKQGISEQALSKGLNTKETQNKFTEHKKHIKDCEERLVYLPYFLDIRNLRETNRRKKEFLINNRFTSEKGLLASRNKKLIKRYNSISTNIRLKDIKWTSTEVVIDKYGRIETLPQYRYKRLVKGIVSGFFTMLFTTLIARELFSGVDSVPLWAKFIKLITYIVAIFSSVVMSILKNYEKGAFGVANDLDEINAIWHEFHRWTIPQSMIDDVEKNNIMNDITLGGDDALRQNNNEGGTYSVKEDLNTENEKKRNNTNTATNIQEQ